MTRNFVAYISAVYDQFTLSAITQFRLLEKRGSAHQSPFFERSDFIESHREVDGIGATLPVGLTGDGQDSREQCLPSQNKNICAIIQHRWFCFVRTATFA